MAIGVDVGSSGTTTADDFGTCETAAVLPAMRHVVAGLAGRVGDPVPSVFRDEMGRTCRLHAHDLYAAEVVRAMRSAGIEPDETQGRGVVVAVPCWWTTHAKEAAADAIRAAGGERIVLVDSAEAAVRGHLRTESELDDFIAVLDLGAETTSASVVHHGRARRPKIIGRPAAQLGESGNELDARLLHHLLRGLGESGGSLDVSNPDTILAATELLERCHEAKHSLSMRPAATLGTRLAGPDSRLRLVRGEFEEIALPWARASVKILADAIETSGQAVRSVLLVGGGAHIPLIAQSVSAGLGLDVVVSPRPTEITAVGAREQAAGVDHRAAVVRPGRRHAEASSVAAGDLDTLEPRESASVPMTKRRPWRRHAQLLDAETDAAIPVEECSEPWSLAAWHGAEAESTTDDVKIEPSEPDPMIQSAAPSPTDRPADAAARIRTWPADVDEVHTWLSASHRPARERHAGGRRQDTPPRPATSAAPSLPDVARRQDDKHLITPVRRPRRGRERRSAAVFAGSHPGLRPDIVTSGDGGGPSASEPVAPEGPPPSRTRRRSSQATGLLLVLLVCGAQLTWADRPTESGTTDPAGYSPPNDADGPTIINQNRPQLRTPPVRTRQVPPPASLETDHVRPKTAAPIDPDVSTVESDPESVDISDPAPDRRPPDALDLAEDQDSQSDNPDQTAPGLAPVEE
ncbi:Hsp70 family protein [Aeromicrobium sp.]|uniref:Hsp70 family protein n=1 Tax=Aeromicrobium sp. TaxID=1871063 RepID=UPI003C59AD0A